MIMKKTIALLLALVTMLALVACGAKKPCETCVDADANNVCDVCGKTLDNGGNQPGPDAPAALTVADFAAAMKNMGSTRVEIAVTETSDLGTLSSVYKITFGQGENATIAYSRELWDVSEDIFSTTAPAKKTEIGEIRYVNGTYTGAMEGTAGAVAQLALNLSADQLASVQINGDAAKGAQLIAAVPRANSANVLGVALPSDAAISVTMNAGAKSISAFTLSYMDGANQVAFSALYQ